MVGGYLFCGIQPVIDKQGVKLRYFSSRQEADHESVEGVSRLIQMQFRAKFKQLKKYCKVTFSGPSALWLTIAVGGTAQICESILTFIVRSFLAEHPRSMLSREIYQAQIELIDRIDVDAAGRQIIDNILIMLRQRKETSDLINKFGQLTKKSGSFDRDLFEDLENQLEQITPSNFLDHYSVDDLNDCVRYLKSLAIRSERAYNNPRKDLEKRSKLKTHQQNVVSFTKKIEELSPECEIKFNTYRTMLAEFRISLFSPEVKTTLSVSEKKLAQAWKELASGC